ncbi:RagB/SusD family nutrient uptake outer membrane protein [Parasegetibacter sp. NRK P23]|uniref:RagB/SusD family nutrient uptake outer membrane protein n=1 Tax=Parasegetibacter sp. NRK P23 TaxID=2942999 RepID=UPI002044A52B|nr:RagB/SusD family nutrient uptake outer membrane protein [Parasegetibacter sp. NRK P23]MCM5528681.1 RagB/SusD family nutrient uptake outer membrane protein [Parasegetibacter sp. NRK P23]
MKRKNIWIPVALSLSVSMLASCKKFLDVVPDNVATIENAFKLRNEAEKYLFTLYSYQPKGGDGWYNVGLLGGDEIWLPQNDQAHWHPIFRIAQGQQNKDAPLFDEWTGSRKGNSTRFDHQKLWRGIRQCNIFIENMENPTLVPDITQSERERWIAEAKFLKAYYHFYMMRMYGPIPIMDKNLGLDDDVDGSLSKRMPVDSCVNYISNLLDESYDRLPPRITEENTQLGRITQTIAMAVKAKLWITAASPLFNGNADMASFRDKEGVALFNPTFDANKWVKARDAIKVAIETAEANGHGLYKYTVDFLGLTDTTKTQLSIRNAVTERWGRENVWPNAQMYFVNEALCMPPMERGTNTTRAQLQGIWAPPMKIAKMFYTQNGVPIEEDRTLNFSNYEQLRTATSAERNYIEPGFVTARLNFDREPRFYASLGFDGGVWYMKDATTSGNDRNTFYVKAKNGDKAGFGDFVNWNETGYFIKKLVHWESTTAGSSAPVYKQYPWPEIRMSDLLLMYAEALNEVEPGSAQAIQYVDMVRERAGLKGVVQSWSNYSSNPTKYTTQDGLREIIHRERLIELAFEGQRFWDLRRWKKAFEEQNKDITGWTIMGKTAETYYRERVIYSQRFLSPRDYFWPIGLYDTRRNPNLVENPGW